MGAVLRGFFLSFFLSPSFAVARQCGLRQRFSRKKRGAAGSAAPKKGVVTLLRVSKRL